MSNQEFDEVRRIVYEILVEYPEARSKHNLWILLFKYVERVYGVRISVPERISREWCNPTTIIRRKQEIQKPGKLLPVEEYASVGR